MELLAGHDVAGAAILLAIVGMLYLTMLVLRATRR